MTAQARKTEAQYAMRHRFGIESYRCLLMLGTVTEAFGFVCCG